MGKDLNLRAPIAFGLILAFLVNVVGPIPTAQAQEFQLPVPGVMLHLSPGFIPAELKGITVHPENPLMFDFIIYRGDKVLSNQQKREDYKRLVKYFLASLAIPDEDQWVNLSPYEKDRIIKDDFGKTLMGRDLLSQDYILKQITASLIYPEDNLGKEFWNNVYAKAQQQYGTTNVPVNTFNKVWIIPDNALIYEKGNTAYVLKNHLKVMLEEDYLALSKRHVNQGTWLQPCPQAGCQPNQPLNVKASQGTNRLPSTIGSQLIRQLILPALEKEVNEGKNFALLRQVYSGMLLAAWFKRTLKESILGQIYANKTKVKGVDQDPKNNEAIYQRYLQAYRKGVFNYIKEDIDKYTHEEIPRKYFSGGETGYFLDAAMREFHRNTITIDHALTAQQADDVTGQVSSEDLAQVTMDNTKAEEQSTMLGGLGGSHVTREVGASSSKTEVGVSPSTTTAQLKVLNKKRSRLYTPILNPDLWSKMVIVIFSLYYISFIPITLLQNAILISQHNDLLRSHWWDIFVFSSISILFAIAKIARSKQKKGRVQFKKKVENIFNIPQDAVVLQKIETYRKLMEAWILNPVSMSERPEAIMNILDIDPHHVTEHEIDKSINDHIKEVRRLLTVGKITEDELQQYVNIFNELRRLLKAYTVKKAEMKVNQADVLVRGAEMPTSTSETLLRSTRGSEGTKPEELLRIAQGGTNSSAAMTGSKSSKTDNAMLDLQFAADILAVLGSLIALAALGKLLLKTQETAWIRTSPVDYEYYYRLGNILFDLGRYQEAMKNYEESIKRNSKFANAYIKLGIVLSKLKLNTEAVARYKRALRLDPKSALAYYNLGIAYYNLGVSTYSIFRFNEAVESYRMAIKLDPTVDNKLYLNLGLALIELERNEEAIDIFQKAAELEPNVDLPYFYLGQIFFKMGRYDGAIENYQMAVKLDPNNALAHINLGDAFEKEGRYEKAVESYQVAIKLDPKILYVHGKLATVLSKIDRKEGANENFAAEAQLSQNQSIDHAMHSVVSRNGGIDLNSVNLNMQIKRDGRGVVLPLSQQDLAQLSNIKGLDPVILSIKPASQTPLLSQLQISPKF